MERRRVLLEVKYFIQSIRNEVFLFLSQRFLRHLCAHPTLSADQAVQTFLLQNDGWKHIVDTSHVLTKVIYLEVFHYLNSNFSLNH